MKKILLALFAVAGLVAVAHAGASTAPNSFYPDGGYQIVTIDTEAVTAITTTPFDLPCNSSSRDEIWIQNTGTNNITWFDQLSSSNTANMHYLIPGQYMIEDRYMGDRYFTSASGSYLSYTIHRKR